MLADFFKQHSSTLLIFLIATLCIAMVFWPQIRKKIRQKQLQDMPFPATWRKILREHWPIYRRLPADLQLRLKKHIQLFLLEKQFIGCDGLVVSDDNASASRSTSSPINTAKATTTLSRSWDHFAVSAGL
ncbi:MAG: zinc-dependent peptidase [Rheinheimera sp.]|nr:zinc-dependent peptidase [Rheinheimera sp.]